MTNPVADDFAVIARRQAEIRKEMQDALERAPTISCSTCGDFGWVRAFHGLVYAECPQCNNPERKHQP